MYQQRFGVCVVAVNVLINLKGSEAEGAGSKGIQQPLREERRQPYVQIKVFVRPSQIALYPAKN